MSQLAVDSDHDIQRDCDSVIELLLDEDYGRAVSVHQQCQHYYGCVKADSLLLRNLAQRAAEARLQGNLGVVRRLHNAANDKLSLAPSDVVRQVFATADALVG